MEGFYNQKDLVPVRTRLFFFFLKKEEASLAFCDSEMSAVVSAQRRPHVLISFISRTRQVEDSMHP